MDFYHIFTICLTVIFIHDVTLTQSLELTLTQYELTWGLLTAGYLCNKLLDNAVIELVNI